MEVEQRDHYRKMVRSFHDQTAIESFRFHGLSIAEMDRAELLGVISFLLKNAGTPYLRQVRVEDVNAKPECQ